MGNLNKNCLTREQGLAIADAFYKSGLKPKDFCSQNNILYHILQYWKNKYDKISSPSDNSTTFVPVKLLMPAAAQLKITINAAIAVEVSNGCDLKMLKQVLEVCKSCG